MHKKSIAIALCLVMHVAPSFGAESYQELVPGSPKMTSNKPPRRSSLADLATSAKDFVTRRRSSSGNSDKTRKIIVAAQRTSDDMSHEQVRAHIRACTAINEEDDTAQDRNATHRQNSRESTSS